VEAKGVIEDGGVEMEIEDFQIASKLNLDPEVRETIEELSLDEVDVNGNRGLHWEYIATLEVDGRPIRWHFTTTYFRRGTQNLTLSVWTAEEFYERRQAEIDGIVWSFDW